MTFQCIALTQQNPWNYSNTMSISRLLGVFRSVAENWQSRWTSWHYVKCHNKFTIKAFIVYKICGVRVVSLFELFRVVSCRFLKCCKNIMLPSVWKVDNQCFDSNWYTLPLYFAHTLIKHCPKLCSAAQTGL